MFDILSHQFSCREDLAWGMGGLPLTVILSLINSQVGFLLQDLSSTYFKCWLVYL